MDLSPVPAIWTRSEVDRLRFTADGQRLLSADSSGYVLVHRVEDGALVHRLEHPGAISHLVPHPQDPYRLVTVCGVTSTERLVCVWDLKTGTTTHQWPTNWVVHALAFGPDDMLGLCLSHTHIKLARLTTDSQTLRVQQVDPLVSSITTVHGATFDTTGTRLAVDHNAGLDVWDIARRLSKTRCPHREWGPRALRFSADGRYLLRGGYHGAVQCWALDEDPPRRTVDRQSPSTINDLDVDPTSTWVATRCAYKLRMWTLPDLEAVPGPRCVGVGSALAFSPVDQLLAARDGDVIRVWNQLDAPALLAIPARRQGVASLQLSPGARHLVVVSHDADAWDLREGRTLRIADDVLGSTAVLSSDSVVTAHRGGIRRWHVETGAPMGMLLSASRPLRYPVGISPDGSRLTLWDTDDAQVTDWDLRNGRRERAWSCALPDPDGIWGPIYKQAHRFDERLMLTVHAFANEAEDGDPREHEDRDEALVLWDEPSGRVLDQLQLPSALGALALCPHRRSLAVLMDHNDGAPELHRWSIERDRFVSAGTLPRAADTDNFTDLKFYPRSDRLAGVTERGTLVLWDLEHNTASVVLHSARLRWAKIAVAPTERCIIAAQTPERLELWDPERGTWVLQWYWYGEDRWVRLLPDGRFDTSPTARDLLRWTDRTTGASYPSEGIEPSRRDPEAVDRVLTHYLDTPPTLGS